MTLHDLLKTYVDEVSVTGFGLQTPSAGIRAIPGPEDVLRMFRRPGGDHDVFVTASMPHDSRIVVRGKGVLKLRSEGADFPQALPMPVSGATRDTMVFVGTVRNEEFLPADGWELDPSLAGARFLH